MLLIVNLLTAPCFKLLSGLCRGISTEDATGIKTDELQGKTAHLISSTHVHTGVTPLF